jgi:hypothetical protein
MKQVTVGSPLLTQKAGTWRLECPCHGNCPSSIWFEGNGQAPDAGLVGAAFLLPSLLRSMHTGEELDFKPVISELFANRMRHALVPLLKGFCPDLLGSEARINLHNVRKLSQVIDTGSATGMSCGLDSLASARELLALGKDDSMRLTLLSHFNTGNHDALHTGDYSRLHLRRLERARACSTDIGIPLVSVDSNVDEWVPGEFARLHTVRNLAAAHLLAGTVRHYFYANGVRITQTSMAARDTAYIDSLLIPLLSTEALLFHQSTPDMGAPEKTESILGWDIAHRHMNVCYFSETNCGHCEKCLRRMLLLDVAGALEKFCRTFPIESFEKNRYWYVGYVLFRSADSKVYNEVLSYMRKRSYHGLKPFQNRIAWLCRRSKNFVRRITGRASRPL